MRTQLALVPMESINDNEEQPSLPFLESMGDHYVEDDESIADLGPSLGDAVAAASAATSKFITDNPEIAEAALSMGLDLAVPMMGSLLSKGAGFVKGLFGSSGKRCDYDNIPNPFDAVPAKTKKLAYDKVAKFSSRAGFFEGQWEVVYTEGPAKGKRFIVRLYDRGGYVSGPAISGDISSNTYLGKRIKGTSKPTLAGSYYINRCKFYPWGMEKVDGSHWRGWSLRDGGFKAVAKRLDGPVWSKKAKKKPAGKRTARDRDRAKRAKANPKPDRVAEVGGSFPLRAKFMTGYGHIKTAFKKKWPAEAAMLDQASAAWAAGDVTTPHQLINVVMMRVGAADALATSQGIPPDVEEQGIPPTPSRNEDRGQVAPDVEEQSSSMGLYLGIGGAVVGVGAIVTAVVLTRK